MCKLLKVPRSLIYYHIKNRQKENKISEKEVKLENAVIRIFRESRNNYGTRKIKKQLERVGIRASRRKIGKIMKKLALCYILRSLENLCPWPKLIEILYWRLAMKTKHDNIIRLEGYHPTQLKVFFTMVTLYTFYFASNYNLGPATKYIQEELSFTNTEFGVLFTIFTLGFGLGQFVAGFLGDRYNPKMLMLFGAIGSIMANISFALSSNMSLFSLFWGINAVSLAMGWSPGCSILFRWIPQKRWGLFMGFFDAFAFLGGIIIYPIAGFSIYYFGWRSVFFISPGLLFAWTIMFFFVVKSNPQDAGLAVEWTTDSLSHNSNPVCLKDYLKVLTNPTINLICVTAICSQFVRWGLVNWVIKILTESTAIGGYGLSLIIAASIASSMHWGGAFFSIFMGYVSDIVFRGSRWQTITLGFALSGVSLIIVYFTGPTIIYIKGGTIILTILLFISGGCIQGVQAPIFNLPGDILGVRLGGTGVGVINGWSYIGASFAGSALGFMMDQFSLTSGILIMAIISLVGAIIITFVKR